MQINKEEVLLRVSDPTPYTQIQDLQRMKEPYEKLWISAVKFFECHEKWMNGPLLLVNAEEVEEEVNNYRRNLLMIFIIKYFMH